MMIITTAAYSNYIVGTAEFITLRDMAHDVGGFTEALGICLSSIAGKSCCALRRARLGANTYIVPPRNPNRQRRCSASECHRSSVAPY